MGKLDEATRQALNQAGIDAMVAAGISQASIVASPSPSLASSVLTAGVGFDTVRLYAAGRPECPIWRADARRGDDEPHHSHCDRAAVSALGPVLRRIPKGAK